MPPTRPSMTWRVYDHGVSSTNEGSAIRPSTDSSTHCSIDEKRGAICLRDSVIGRQIEFLALLPGLPSFNGKSLLQEPKTFLSLISVDINKSTKAYQLSVSEIFIFPYIWLIDCSWNVPVNARCWDHHIFQLHLNHQPYPADSKYSLQKPCIQYESGRSRAPRCMTHNKRSYSWHRISKKDWQKPVSVYVNWLPTLFVSHVWRFLPCSLEGALKHDMAL